MDEASDEELVTASLHGNSGAFTDLVRRYEARLRGYCGRMLRDKTGGEDAAQEVFLKAYRNLSSFRNESKFSTWLFRIAHNHCLDRLRSTRFLKFFSLNESPTDERRDIERAVATLPDVVGQAATRELLEHLLSCLSPDYRSLVILCDGFGYTYEELSQMVGGSIESIKARLKRARKKLVERRAELEGSKGAQAMGERV